MEIADKSCLTHSGPLKSSEDFKGKELQVDNLDNTSLNYNSHCINKDSKLNATIKNSRKPLEIQAKQEKPAKSLYIKINEVSTANSIYTSGSKKQKKQNLHKSKSSEICSQKTKDPTSPLHYGKNSTFEQSLIKTEETNSFIQDDNHFFNFPDESRFIYKSSSGNSTPHRYTDYAHRLKNYLLQSFNSYELDSP